ncbi:MAG: CPBP family intramembrane metalloprotease [Bacteroidales bacterium]|nr:CPBP family intramembrane metalloprotease [Bacteroidales bacterium]
MIKDFLPILHDKSFFLKIAVLFLLIAVFLLLTMVIGIVVALPFYGPGVVFNLAEMNNLDDPSTVGLLKFFQVVNQLGVFILPPIAFAWLVNRQPLSYLKLGVRFRKDHLILSVMLIFISIPAINMLVVWNEQMDLPDFMNGIENWMRQSEDQTKHLTDAFLNVKTAGGLIVNLLIIAMMAAIGEELLFRGVVLRLLDEKLKNVHLAILISAVLFSSLHMQFYGFIPRTAIGILFGYMYVWTGSLWIPIILHFVFNGTSVVAAYLYNIGASSTDVDSFGYTPNQWIVAGSILISILLLFMIYKTRKA